MSKQESLRPGALYIRVSTHGRQEELSPAAQKRLLLNYAKDHGIVISKEFIYEEKGISGRKAERRPKFMEMIAAAKSKPSPFSVILVWKYSRFARNQEESIVYKSLLRKKCNVDVISVSEPLIDGPFGSLIERIIEWMDEYYSIRLSGEVFRGMSEKAMKGGYQARPPLGYKIVQKGESPVIVPEEAEIIKFIFDKYVNAHMGIFEIARKLNNLGAKTSHGKNFERRSVEYILKNPTYCGMIRWNMTDNQTKEIKAKDDWIVTERTHPAIISKELFQAAQERFEGEYRPSGARPSSTYRHWLSGLVKCPSCGRTMIAKALTDKRYGRHYCYFTCYGYSKGKCLAKTSVSSKKLEPYILEGIRAATESDNLIFSVKAPISPENTNELSILKEQLQRMDMKEQRIKDAYMNGIDTMEEYKENKELLLRERENLEEKIAACSTPRESDDSIDTAMKERIRNVYDIISSSQFSDQEKNEALRSVVEKIIYDRETDTAEIYYFYL